MEADALFVDLDRVTVDNERRALHEIGATHRARRHEDKQQEDGGGLH